MKHTCTCSTCGLDIKVSMCIHLFCYFSIYALDSFFHSFIHSSCLFFSTVTEDLLNVFVRFYPKLLTDDILAGLISPHMQNLRLVYCSKIKPSKFIQIFPQWVQDQAKMATMNFHWTATFSILCMIIYDDVFTIVKHKSKLQLPPPPPLNFFFYPQQTQKKTS